MSLLKIVGSWANSRGIPTPGRESTDAFTMSSPGANEDLRRRVDELNSWLYLVDVALTVRDLFSLETQAWVVAGANVVSPPSHEPVAAA